MNFAEIIMAAGRCASEEEANDAISAMLSPVNDRNYMADVFNTALGYNPINYFSKMEISDAVDKLLKDNYELKNYLYDEEIEPERITALALKIHESHTTRDQMLSIKEALWALCPGMPESLTSIIDDMDIPSDPFDVGGPNKEDDTDDEDDEEFEADMYDDDNELDLDSDDE